MFSQQVIVASVAMHEFITQRKNIESANRSRFPCQLLDSHGKTTIRDAFFDHNDACEAS